MTKQNDKEISSTTKKQKPEQESAKNYKDPTGKNENIGTPQNSGYADKQPGSK